MLLLNGDCIEQMQKLIDDGVQVDSVVTDPPYELGFMGKSWDASGIAFDKKTWKLAFELSKPGGYLLAFSASRNYHRMAVAVEDAGFEIRDQIMWIYGSGFPKSHNLGDGWGTALKPAHEPIVMARKSIEGTNKNNREKYGTGGINIDQCRIETDEKLNIGSNNRENGVINFGMKDDKESQKQNELGRFPANVMHDGSDVVNDIFPHTKSGKDKNPTQGEVSGFFGNKMGYYSQDANYGDEGSAARYFKKVRKAGSELGQSSGWNKHNNKDTEMITYNDDGSAARYFYCPKVSKSERNQGLVEFDDKQYSHDGRKKSIENPYQRNKSISKNNHPTVKPVELMKYLCRLVTPKGGTVLDPFMGSGSTGMAAKDEGFDFIGIEKEKEYFEISEQRIKTTAPLSEFFV